jgi:hypothetical protein
MNTVGCNGCTFLTNCATPSGSKILHTVTQIYRYLALIGLKCLYRKIKARACVCLCMCMYICACVYVLGCGCLCVCVWTCMYVYV